MLYKRGQSVELDKAIESFFKELEPEGLAKTTTYNKRRALAALTEVVGRANRSTRNLTDADFAAALLSLKEGASPEENVRRRRAGLGQRTGRSQASLAADRATFRQFVTHMKRQGWVRANFDPTYRITKSSRDTADMNPDRVRRRRHVPYQEWEALLEAAGRHHPRTRMIVACGLFLGRRAGEIAYLRLRHVNRDRGLVEVFNLKRGRVVDSEGIAFGPWMREELDLYLRWLKNTCGELQPDWYLCGAKPDLTDARVGNTLATQVWPVDPTRAVPSRTVREDIRTALKLFGWTDEMLLGEGGHTLRRSAAIMLEEAGSTEAAQALLDHEGTEMTQHYTGNRKGHRQMKEALAGIGRPGASPAKPAAAVVPVQAAAPEAETKAPVVDLFSRQRIA